ncbi:autotransporter outer membrane beta-barrel domain-containing protein [Orbus wheelerorum]|uniref:autotransporter outer membrane beta-barrel domain-containing protein n=1 Tax=Orbus wheelerorum TaxID=3074111 RepID=UPI00370DD04D
MNKIYKIKKNGQGQSVVTSELAKNKSVSASILAVMVGSALLSVSSLALATPISKTATGSGKTVTISENELNNNETETAIIGVGTDGANSSITITNSIISTSGTNTSAVVGKTTSSTPDTIGKVTVTVDEGTYSTTNSNDANVIVGEISNYTGAGKDVSVTVTSSTVNAAGTGNANGIFASTSADSGKVSIESANSSYNIDTKGNAINGVSNSADNLSISSTSDTIVSTQGGGIYANAQSTGASSIDINSSSSMIVKGNGISSINNGSGSSTITSSSSSITANGIGISSINNGSGSSTITSSSSTITADGVGISSINNGSGANVITVGGTLKSGESGIYATSKSGKININNTASMEILNDSANAIDVISAGGDVNISANDNSIKTNGNNANAFNVVTTGDKAAITVKASHMKYSSTGADTSLVNILSKSASGDIDVRMTSIDANSVGNNANGIIVATDTGSSANNISITTSGGIINLDTPVGSNTNTYGIYAVHESGSVNSGDINIFNTDTAITIGNLAEANDTQIKSHAIKAGILNSASTGIINVTNTGKLVTYSGGSNGIDIVNNGSGTVTLSNSGEIITSGVNSHGISVSGDNNGVMIEQTAGDIVTNGIDSSGINVTGVTSGDIDINTQAGSTITTNGDNSNGITVAGNSSLGNVNINNISDININGKASSGINYSSMPTTQGVTANIINSGNINLSNAANSVIASGIVAQTNANDSLVITNTGNITQTSKTNSLSAIRVNVQENSSTTETNLIAKSSAKSVIINNSGAINAENSMGIAAYLVNGDITINNTGNIATTYNNADFIAYTHGIQAISDTGNIVVNHDGGNIVLKSDPNNTVSNAGIMALQNDSSVANTINVNVNNDAVVDASLGLKGIDVRTSGTADIYIASAAKVTGGAHSGIAINAYSKDGTFTVTNDGTLNSSNDRAIFVQNGGTAAVNVTNASNMTGYIQTGTATDSTFATTNLTNTGAWDLRNTYQAAALNYGNYTKDTEGAAISSFGGGVIDNQGTISLVARNSDLTLDTTGDYHSVGALSMADGASQAQLLNVSRFSNSGIIDLTANGSSKAGNVLVISGSDTAGTNGDGTFVANGGSIKMNTVINQGDADSQSDMLVLDNVELGSAATKIFVTPVVGSTAVETINDGIKLIDVLGTQNNDAFVLGDVVVYGGYEYRLTTGSGQGFYLTYFDKVNNKMVDPNVGTHLANQYIAATMFNQDIYDRRYSVREGNSAIWGRTNYSKAKSDTLNGRQHFKADTYIMQIGADIVKSDDFVGGIYYGYGHSNVKNHSNQSGTKSDGTVDGYMMGIYASWVPDENKGPYADFWGHGALYNNALKGDAQVNKVKYDSYGYALSLEGGYGFVLSEDSDTGHSWILQPHNQIIFNQVNSEAFTDSNGSEFGKSKASGITNRLGVRLYSNYTDNVDKFNPYVEANWLYNNVSEKTKIDIESFDDTIGRNVGEIKVGLLGKLTKDTSIWGQVVHQFGTNSYSKNEVQFNISYEY